MGAIISRFKKKKSTLEILESLESELKLIESYGRQTERQHKRIVGHLLLFSVGTYVMVAVFFYFVFFPASLYDQLLYVVPLLLFPVIIVFLKRVISWWYRRKISRNQVKLLDIQKQKKQLLEEVMDKETYKVARQILEKYAPDQLRKGAPKPVNQALGRSSSEGNNVGKIIPNVNSATLVVPSSMPAISSQISQIRHRHVNVGSSSDVNITPESYHNLPGPRTSTGALQSSSSVALLPSGFHVSQSALPRPVLSENRSLLDRLVEYLVGDGVSQRYALICRHCNAHNGMALKEEFEFLAFRCCYCFHWNPARKQRLQPPKLETVMPEKTENSGSSGESNRFSEGDDYDEVLEEEEEEEEEGEDDEEEEEVVVEGMKGESQKEGTRNSLNSGSLEGATRCSKSSPVIGKEKSKLRETGSDESYLSSKTVSEKEGENAIVQTFPEEPIQE